jgi:ankyrin repeat protein
MNYNKYSIRMLLEEKPENFWNFLKNAEDLKFNEFSWEEIFKLIQYYSDYNEVDFKIPFGKKYYYSSNDFKLLEDLGIDYEHKDYYGNKFLMFALNQRRGSIYNKKDFSFPEEGIKYILNKTTNVYELTSGNENILFKYMNLADGGLDGKRFFELIKKYPLLDIHLVNSDGNNLLNLAISNGCMFVANWLIEQNISINHINKRGNNLLNEFLFLSASGDHFEFFDELLKKIDIIPKCGDSFLETNIDWMLAKEMQQETKVKSQKWVEHILKKIDNGEWYQTDENRVRLKSLLSKKLNENDLTNMNELKSYIHTVLLKLELPIKEKNSYVLRKM